jgi:hypothetical protein
MTWDDVALHYPEFVQWIAAKFGPLPDGDVKQEDYERFKAAWDARTGGCADWYGQE